MTLDRFFVKIDPAAKTQRRGEIPKRDFKVLIEGDFPSKQ